MRRLYAQLDGLEWGAWLVVRIAVGLEFFGSGLGKLGKLNGLIHYFRSLGIPAAEILAPFVASTELVCGALIAVGLVTRPAAVMLCGVMTGDRDGCRSRNAHHRELARDAGVFLFAGGPALPAARLGRLRGRRARESRRPARCSGLRTQDTICARDQADMGRVRLSACNEIEDLNHASLIASRWGHHSRVSY